MRMDVTARLTMGMCCNMDLNTLMLEYNLYNLIITGATMIVV
jgi:hypothetical protein